MPTPSLPSSGKRRFLLQTGALLAFFGYRFVVVVMAYFLTAAPLQHSMEGDARRFLTSLLALCACIIALRAQQSWGYLDRDLLRQELRAFKQDGEKNRVSADPAPPAGEEPPLRPARLLRRQRQWNMLRLRICLLLSDPRTGTACLCLFLAYALPLVADGLWFSLASIAAYAMASLFLFLAAYEQL